MSFFAMFADFAGQNRAVAALDALHVVAVPVSEIFVTHTFGALVSAVEAGSGLGGPVAMVVYSIVVLQLVLAAGCFLDCYISPLLNRFVHDKLIAKLLEQYDSDFRDPNSGELISKFCRYTDVMVYWISRTLFHVASSIVLLVISASYFAAYDWALAALTLAFAAALVAIYWVSPIVCVGAAQRKEDLYNDYIEAIDEVFRNLIAVFTSGQARGEQQRMGAIGDAVTDAYADATHCLVKFMLAVTPVAVLFFVGFVVRSYALVRQKRVAISGFISMLAVVTLIFSMMVSHTPIVRDIGMDYGAIVGTESMWSATPPPTVDRNVAAVPGPGLGLADVTFAYPGASAPTLRGVTVAFKRGRVTVITGPIGSGKSTVLKLLLCLHRPASGDLYARGKWYSAQSASEVRAGIGYMPQDAVLFDRTVLENIKYGNSPDLTDAQVVGAIEEFGIAGEFSSLPQGVRSRVGKGGNKLSGGQRQLVWCLRILFRNPDILIMDEPTASMDGKTKELLTRLLDRVMANDRTVIMVSHDDFLTKYANETVVLPG